MYAIRSYYEPTADRRLEPGAIRQLPVAADGPRRLGDRGRDRGGAWLRAAVPGGMAAPVRGDDRTSYNFV